MQTSRILPILPAGLALAVSLLLAACGKEAQQGPAGGMPGAPAVTVVTVQPESVPVTTELPGRTSPYLVAELRPVDPHAGGDVEVAVARPAEAQGAESEAAS